MANEDEEGEALGIKTKTKIKLIKKEQVPGFVACLCWSLRRLDRWLSHLLHHHLATDPFCSPKLHLDDVSWLQGEEF